MVRFTLQKRYERKICHLFAGIFVFYRFCDTIKSLVTNEKDTKHCEKIGVALEKISAFFRNFLVTVARGVLEVYNKIKPRGLCVPGRHRQGFL